MNLRNIAAVFLAFVFAIVAATATGAEQASFGVSGDTAGGCDLPDVYVAYERQTEGVDIHGRVRQGGNRACRSATSADIAIERDFGLVSLELGYISRGVSFAGPSVQGGDAVFYGSMSAADASANLDFDVAEGLNIEAGYNIVNDGAPRVALNWQNQAHRDKRGGIELDADMTRYPSSGTFTTLAASWEAVLGDGWGVEFFATYTMGTDNVPDPIRWRSDQGLTPADPPTDAYAFGFGFTRELRR